MRKLLSIAAVLVLCFASPAHAGTTEDFEAGKKAFDAGDLVGAMNPLKRAADADHVEAQVLLAYILDYSEFDEDAMAYYRKAAEKGNADGQFGLGVMIANGDGVPKKDPIEGRRWIKLAAEQGHKMAIGVMAQAYLGGQLGLTEAERNNDETLRWVRLAAEQDSLPAIDALARAYREGALGLSPDPAQATELEAKAKKLRNVKDTKGKKKKR
ncbi:tetratricopeptide repeat protein [Denitratisoma oestradiolicum]|uniref:Sel1 repeat family protein n=1 Tax=Denitratisoma oestradiolicum TaxID=311182 RepID=A0A6S6Y504_9PROT|nr:tetratricopeptide repeat protein [Denitratisoma oestradiolicum]TWO80601.1 hypothetical protein CBW56_09195 [Denitratisoma oestradiolicum]CAB1367678.1 conserved exported protein of unknown function [Denitratisoma oestradiolicum]